MKQQTETLWTLIELSQQVQDALTVDPLAPPNGRIRAVPDSRTIRYYTTLGLIDRPAAMRGRTAFYNERHLQQLVAIKRLQAQGLSLAEVQKALTGIPDEELATLAGLSPASPTPARTVREGFWRAEPPDDTVETAASASPAISHRATEASTLSEPSDIPNTDLYHGLVLTPGVTLLLQGGAAPSPDDIRDLRHAAEPLLTLLRQRGLNRNDHVDLNP